MDSEGDVVLQQPVPVNSSKPNAAGSEKQKVLILDRNRNSPEGVMRSPSKALTSVPEKSMTPSSSSSSPSSSTTAGSPTFKFVHPVNGNLLDRNRNLSTIEDLESYLFECSTCNVKQDVSTIFLHAKNVHGVFVCLYCLQFFKFAKELMVHLHREHRALSQRYSSGHEFLQYGGSSTALLCVECNKVFLSEAVETVKSHAHECRKSTGICPKCGTILLLSLLGVHIASCKGSMNLNLEGNSGMSTSQLRNREGLCKFCVKKFSPSKMAAHMRACSARGGRMLKPLENGSPDGIGFGKDHLGNAIRKRTMFPALPQLLGERGFVPVVVSKKNKVMPELNPVVPTPTVPSSASSGTTTTFNKRPISDKPNSAQQLQSSVTHTSNTDVQKPKDAVLVKSQKPLQKVLVSPNRRTTPLHNFSKPAGVVEKPPVSVASISSLSSNLTLTPVMAKFMNGDIKDEEEKLDDSPVKNSEKEVQIKGESPTTVSDTKIVPRESTTPIASREDEPHRPKRSLKKINREDFMYETVSKRSYHRSHSISASSMSAAASSRSHNLTSTKYLDISDLGSPRQRSSVSVSEITINVKQNSLASKGYTDLKSDSSVVMFDYDQDVMKGKDRLSNSANSVTQQKRQALSQNIRKLCVLQPKVLLTHVDSMNMANSDYQMYEDSESEPEPEVKLDPLLVEQDTFKRLGLLILELCEKLIPQFSVSGDISGNAESSNRHELIVNYNINDKSSDYIITDMLRKTAEGCLYCRQVKLIRVDKRQLVMHLLTTHSWQLRCLRTPAMLLKSLKARGEKLTDEQSPLLESPIKKEKEDAVEVNNTENKSDATGDLTLKEPVVAENTEKVTDDGGISNSVEKTDNLGTLSITNNQSSSEINPEVPVKDNSPEDPVVISEKLPDTKSSADHSIESASACSNDTQANESCDNKTVDGNTVTKEEINCERSVTEEKKEDCSTDEKHSMPTEDNSNVNENKTSLKIDQIKDEKQSTSNNNEDLSKEDEGEINHIEWKDFKLALLDKVFRSENVVFVYKDSDLEVFGELPCECLLCGFMADSQINLFPHWRKVHRGVAMKCAMCHGKFLFAGALFSHLCLGTPTPVIRDTTNIAQTAIASTPATQTANGVAGGYGMVGDQTGGDKDDGSSDTILLRYQCNVCENMQLPGFFNYMVHLRKDHTKCELCLETLKTQKDLEHHMKKHKLNHFCWKCGATYCAKQNFMTHLFWKHGTESEDCSKCLKKKWPHIYHFCIPPTTFMCDTCGHYFTKPKSLIVHRRLHTGEKLRKCPKKDCLEKFVSKKLLAKHVENVHVNPPKVPDPVPEILPISEDAVKAESSTLTNETDNLPEIKKEELTSNEPGGSSELDPTSDNTVKPEEDPQSSSPVQSDVLSTEKGNVSNQEGYAKPPKEIVGNDSSNADDKDLKIEASSKAAEEENPETGTGVDHAAKESDVPKQPFNIQEIKGPNLSEESDCSNSDEEDRIRRKKKSGLANLLGEDGKSTPSILPPSDDIETDKESKSESKLTNGSIFSENNAATMVAKDLDLSDDSSSSFGDAEDEDDDCHERLNIPHTRCDTQNLPNSLITKLDDDDAMDIDDALLEKAVSENFKKVPRLDLDSALLDDPEKLKQHEDFGSMSPLLPPLDDFNFNMLQIPTFEENSLPEHIIQENAIFTLANEHDYCIATALKRPSPLPSGSSHTHGGYSMSNGRPSLNRSSSQKKLKVCKPSTKKSNPKKRKRSSSSSSSSSSSCSSCGSNCSCSSSSSSSSCSSSSSDSETKSRKPNQSKGKSKHEKHESKSNHTQVAEVTKKPRKQVIPKAPKPPKLPKPPPKKRGPKPNPNKIKGEPKPKRKYKKGNNKVRGRPRLARNDGAVPLENYIPESDLETEDSGSDEIFHKRQLTEVIGKEVSPVDEVWTMSNEKFLLQFVRGVKDYEELRPPPEPPKPKAPKRIRGKSMSYTVKKSGQQPRLKVRNVPIKPLIVKRQVGAEMTEDEKTVFMYGQTPLIGTRPLQTSFETNSTSNVITISRGPPNAATAAPASALVLGKRPLASAGQKFSSSPVSRNMKESSGDLVSLPKQSAVQQNVNNINAKGDKSSKASANSSLLTSASPPLAKKARGRAKKVVTEEVPDEKLYCICQSPHDTVSQMIGCDDKDCEYQWFHFECVDILIPPKGKWFCSDCREKRRKKYMKMKKNDLSLVSSPVADNFGNPQKDGGIVPFSL